MMEGIKSGVSIASEQNLPIGTILKEDNAEVESEY